MTLLLNWFNQSSVSYKTIQFICSKMSAKANGRFGCLFKSRINFQLLILKVK